jgi:peptidoglycan/LPS O-acetylase OafA/YrhL
VSQDNSSYLWNPRKVASDLREPTLTSFVDLARWLAAMLVMLAHLRAPLLLGYGGLPSGSRPLWVKGWYFVTGMHSEAVLVFFVLSGFLVGGLAAARMCDGRFDPLGYAIDRFARLYIGFIPALALTLMLDSIGTHWFSASGLYDGTHPMLMEKDPGKIFGAQLGWATIIGNVLMLQSYFVLPLGSNGPLWTLSNEFWFYAVFGLVLAGFLKKNTQRSLLIGAAVLVCATLGPVFLGYFGMWLIGFFAACFAPRRTGPPWIAAVAMGMYLGLIRTKSAMIDESLVYGMIAHYGLALVFGWLILAVRNHRIASLEKIAELNRFMADFSYSLYLIHFPLLLLAIAVLGKLTGIEGYLQGFSPTDTMGIASYLGLVAFIIAMSWLFAQATEQHTKHLRNWLKLKLSHQPLRQA